MIATLAEVKAYLGIDVSDVSNDAFLTAQIGVITEAMEAYCHRHFALATYTQTFYSEDMPNTNKLELFAYPVQSITSVTYPDATTLDPALDMRIQKSSGVLIRSYGSGFYCGDGFLDQDSVEVVYVAGYATVPMTVKSVLFSLVQERYNKKSAGVGLNFGNDVQSVSIPGTLSVVFDYTLSNNDRETPFGMILGSYLNILDGYRSDRAVMGRGTLDFVDYVDVP